MLNPKYLLVICLTAFISCKKKKEADPDSIPTSPAQPVRAHYTDVLDVSSLSNHPLFVAKSGFSGSGNFYVIQKMSGSSYNLIVCDREANVRSTKLIQLGPDSLIDICGSKTTQDFYTLTASHKYAYTTGPVINAYVYKSSAYDSTHCGGDIYSYNYEFDDQFQLNNPVQTQNSSQLKKIDENGNEVWSKTLDGNFFSGNALETDLDGNIYVLTATKPALLPKEVTALTTSIPYYTFKRDSNSFSLHKFKASGDLIFKQTVPKVFEEGRFSFEPSLALSANAVFVSSINNFITFDLNGNALSKDKPLKNVCYNTILSVVSTPLIPNVIATGELHFTPNSSNGYYIKLLGATPKITVINPNTSLTIFAADNSQNTYSGGSMVLTKISASGKEVYSKTLFNGSNLFTVNAHNHVIDIDDSFYCFSLENGVIKVYKFDENGRFD